MDPDFPQSSFKLIMDVFDHKKQAEISLSYKLYILIPQMKSTVPKQCTVRKSPFVIHVSGPNIRGDYG